MSASDPSRVYAPFDDLLRAPAARPAAPRPAAGARGADVVVELELEFVEAVRGASWALRYTAEAECSVCHGTGRHRGLCETCAGRGRLQDERVARVRIPSGSKDGSQLRLTGQGHAGGPGGEPGDLIVELRVAAAQDTPLLRVIAAAGAVCALVLAVITLVLYL